MSIQTNGISPQELIDALGAVELSYSDAPALSSTLATLGLEMADLSPYLTNSATAEITDSGVYNGGPEVRPAEAIEALAETAGLSTAAIESALVSSLGTRTSDLPAQAVAVQGTNDTGGTTLFLGFRGTDNLADGVMGGQAYTAAGQAAYFEMLIPFFEAAESYAAANGIERIVVVGGSLGGTVVDLFALTLKIQWEASFDVFTVSLASSGVSLGAVEAIGAALGMNAATLPQVQPGNVYAQPDNHINISNSEDPVPFPEALPEQTDAFAIPQVLIPNAKIAGALVLDQTAYDGLDVPYISTTAFSSPSSLLLALSVALSQGSVYGVEHGDAVYATAIADLMTGPGLVDLTELLARGSLVGGSNGDTLALSTSSFDIAQGLGGDDMLIGTASDDTLLGGSGNDTLTGNVGSDVLDGGTGTDVAVFSYASTDARVSATAEGFRISHAGASDHVIGVESFAFSDGTLNVAQLTELANASQTPSETTETGRVVGASGADFLIGGTVDDTIVGDDGNDTIDAGAGNDRVWAGANDTGADQIRGGAGGDTLAGGAGNDLIEGEGDDDLVFGGGGADSLIGGNGNDTAWSGSENDQVQGNDGDDIIGGGAGQDTLAGGAGNDVIYAADGNDSVTGDSGVDSVFGGAGNDTIAGGMGNDALFGGAGNDVIVFEDHHGNDSVGAFHANGDNQLDLQALELSGMGDLEITGLGNGVLIDTGQGTILLWGSEVSDVTASDFLF